MDWLRQNKNGIITSLIASVGFAVVVAVWSYFTSLPGPEAFTLALVCFVAISHLITNIWPRLGKSPALQPTTSQRVAVLPPREEVAASRRIEALTTMDSTMSANPNWSLCIEPPALPHQTVAGAWEGDSIAFRLTASVRHRWIGDMKLTHWEVEPTIYQRKLDMKPSNRHEPIQPCTARQVQAEVAWTPTAEELRKFLIRKNRVTYLDCTTAWLVTCEDGEGNKPQLTGAIPFHIIVPPAPGQQEAEIAELGRKLDRVREIAVAGAGKNSLGGRRLSVSVDRQTRLIRQYGSGLGELDGCTNVDLTDEQSAALSVAMQVGGNWLLRENGRLELQQPTPPGP